mmetsp:Transcript_41386/g.61879  ORF Transcript_41386/g.61879 Transcript_41386/m.61879 type:complete len:273 (+) Transcript_41386:1-819(+)
MEKPWETEKELIDSAVAAMTDQQVNDLLAGDRPSSDRASKQYSRLVGYFMDDTIKNKEGVAAAQLLPKSDYVLTCLQDRLHRTAQHNIMKLFQRLKRMNPGAAGSAFELLVHKFWEEKIFSRASVSLRLSDDGERQNVADLTIGCADLKFHRNGVELWEKNNVDMPLGYFTSQNSTSPAFDSILRWKNQAGEVEVLAFQISIAQEHTRTPRDHNLLGCGKEEKRKKKEKHRLALWDFRQDGKTCTWKPRTSDSWRLLYVQCTDFDSWASNVL